MAKYKQKMQKMVHKYRLQHNDQQGWCNDLESGENNNIWKKEQKSDHSQKERKCHKSASTTRQ